MASATNLKKKVLANGKVKYQAQVWHEGRFYCSKTFDMGNVARDYKQERLRAIVRGKFKPAAERAAQRRAEEALDQPMTHWASLYQGAERPEFVVGAPGQRWRP
ncbi:hypothetical protein [Roseateles sp. LYH14W]|uniref:Integrase n=1 Tax=Pelomonas parva TaxID=3299032 RepID=A0ABW7F1F3_9BURK